MATRSITTERRALLVFVAAVAAICVVPASLAALVQATTAPVAFEAEGF